MDRRIDLASMASTLKEILPRLSHAALILPVDDMTDMTNLTPGYLRLSIIPLRGPEDLKEAFASIEREKPQALVVPASSLLYARRREFVEFASKNCLPTIYGLREPVVDGGLISVSRDLSAIAARKASVPQLQIFELVINLKTAKTLGLTIPPSLLARADHVIE
jgi:putative ABC transport system substrate-binding protein